LPDPCIESYHGVGLAAETAEWTTTFRWRRQYTLLLKESERRTMEEDPRIRELLALGKEIQLVHTRIASKCRRNRDVISAAQLDAATLKLRHLMSKFRRAPEPQLPDEDA
jgi:hypothetical protein